MKTFLKTLNKKSFTIGTMVYLIYFLLYYWSIDYLNFGVEGSLMKWAPNWTDLIFKQISTFTFEPVGLIQAFSIQVYIVPVNIMIGGLLGFLVFMNVTASLYIRELPKQCKIDHKYNGLIGILPSFLTGFACCAPTFLISLSSILGSSVAFLSRLFVWLLPISILLLCLGLYKSYKIINQY